MRRVLSPYPVGGTVGTEETRGDGRAGGYVKLVPRWWRASAFRAGPDPPNATPAPMPAPISFPAVASAHAAGLSAVQPARRLECGVGLGHRLPEGARRQGGCGGGGGRYQALGAQARRRAHAGRDRGAGGAWEGAGAGGRRG